MTHKWNTTIHDLFKFEFSGVVVFQEHTTDWKSTNPSPQTQQKPVKTWGRMGVTSFL
jgi:hypothetical protein